MGENSYKYLFPYERVPVHSRIIIYGAGTLGQDYLRQMQMTGYCEVIAMADRNHSQYPPMIVPVIPPERIHELSFDYVVVALRMAAAFSEVERVLKRELVDEDRIICIFERQEIKAPIFREQLLDRNDDKRGLAFSRLPLSIAVLATGGYGDMVIQKRFIMELLRLAPGCAIDFYNIKAIDFLKHLYIDCPNVNRIIPDLGSRYSENHKEYALALTIEACHFIKVDKWDKKAFTTGSEGPYQEFAESIDKLMTAAEAEEADISTPAHLTMTRRLYQGLDAYSGFNYNGAFQIRDKEVPIPLDTGWEPAFLSLGLQRYVTVNFGNGDCADGSKVAKSWDKSRFEQLVSSLHERYPDVAIVQIGAESSERLTGADKYILGTDFRLSVYILKGSLLHVDIEGGLVHIATQLGTKCAVLFGPTVKEYYGYEQNINIQAGACHGCWGLYPDVNRCARGMEEPECMRSITPEMVMEHIESYMDAVLRQ
ncbi:MAG TPA: hypothetical protein DDY31_10120 [Lachnospiraceae bacterium]|nr:hypothetical protein [Lachnospiraceae bacterium]